MYAQTQYLQVLQVEYYAVRYLNDIIKMMSIIYNVHYYHQSHEKYNTLSVLCTYNLQCYFYTLMFTLIIQMNKEQCLLCKCCDIIHY